MIQEAGLHMLLSDDMANQNLYGYNWWYLVKLEKRKFEKQEIGNWKFEKRENLWLKRN